MKTIVLFDIDNTLFDTKTWSVELVEPVLAEALGVENEDVARVKGEYKATLARYTDFHPAQFLDWLQEEFEGDRAQLQSLFFKPEFFQHALFDDVIPTLRALKETHTLGIFSEGAKDFQTTKLEHSGLLPWFDPAYTFILKRKIEPNVFEQIPDCTIIDDREDVMEVLLGQGQVRPIWLNRVDHAAHHDAETIHTLLDVIPLLLNQEIDHKINGGED